MEGKKRKTAPLTSKIKRIFSRRKGVKPHELYPKEYFWRCWFNEADANGIKAVARIKKVTKKEAAHIIFERGFKQIMGELVAQDIDAMDTPEAIFKQDQIARAVAPGLGVTNAKQIKIVTDDTESEDFASTIRKILDKG